jgi:hypothetical protein
MSPLWAGTPEKLPNVGPRSESPKHGINSMADALDQIASTPSRSSRQQSPQQSPSPLAHALQGYPKRMHSQQLSSTTTLPVSNLLLQGRASPSVLETQPEPIHHLATGDVAARLQHQYSNVNGVEEMEWSPSQSQSEHRAFNPPRSFQFQTRPFNEAPAAEQPSPFWYKVPPAPITPAQRLRNPPNQPRLRISSQETKQNFFNNITHRKSVVEAGDAGKELLPRDTIPHNKGVEFAQQRFFAPETPSEAGNTLADLLTSFSLGNSDVENPTPVEAGTTTRHICQGLALFLGLFFWNHAFFNPTQHSRNVMMTVLVACALIGVRTILDNTTLRKAGTKIRPGETVRICLGGLELAAAVYGFLQILARKSDNENFASLGTVLIGEMMVHEVWLAFFGH